MAMVYVMLDFIPFSKPTITGNELLEIQKAISQGTLAGNGTKAKACEAKLTAQLKTRHVLLTSSCTHSLELSALLLDIVPGDEVIVSSYTFFSTANAFLLRGAIVKTVDVEGASLNMNPLLLESAITKKTKAIVIVHYGGISCNLDILFSIADAYHIPVVEDAAQALYGSYHNKSLGSLGTVGCFSFHGTKIVTSGGEGGALTINKTGYSKKARLLQEKGTDKYAWSNKSVSRYSWQSIGSSWLMNEVSAAFLLSQLEQYQTILQKRLDLWHRYQSLFLELSDKNCIERFPQPEWNKPNAYMAALYCKNSSERSRLQQYFQDRGISAIAHFDPLHKTPYGVKHIEFVGEDECTTNYSKRLLRLPLYHDLSFECQARILDVLQSFYLRMK